ncbi:GRAM-domain-containing protein [Pisolithus croceorrhizus]|nr:GRAM-domain-containing protein [Pisolithus croceorrhizus]
MANATSQVPPLPNYPSSSYRQISLSKSDFSDKQYQTDSSESTGGSESDDELDLNEENIPVTGFATFHELFPNIPEGDYLIEDYGCALQREILIQGRIYISENHICFHANIFGWITDLSIPIYEITGLEKKMTAFVIPNAIQITTRQAKYTFASFLSRDTTYDVIANIWRLARPEYVVDDAGSRTNSSRDVGSASSGSDTAAVKGTGPAAGANKMTHCSCSKNGGHLSEVALETVLPGTPEKIYNLMFASGFIKHFMRVDQKLMGTLSSAYFFSCNLISCLTDIQISDWIPVASGPLNNSVGPKQTKCELHDETVYCDFDDHVVMMTTTKTPDVPSGGAFAVKTRTCIMWASAISTRVIVTTNVEWTGLIESSAIEGQKQYHADLDKAMRIRSRPFTEGAEPGLDGVSGEEVWKARERDRNRRGLQWAYDTIRRSEAWEQSSSTTILWFVIVALVFSNLWTLSLVGKREEAGRRKEAKKARERERWVQEVVHSIWEEMSTRPSGSFMPALQLGHPTDWKAEIADLRQALDAVEERVRVIRESLDALD